MIRSQRLQQSLGRSQSPDAVHTRTDHLTRHTQEIAQDLVLKVAQMTDNAIGVDTRWFFYYKRKTVGRVCTCVQGEQSSRDGNCGICYGTGIVGGYDKYGTIAEIVDSTYPGLVTVNVVRHVETRPTRLTLDPLSVAGMVEVRVPLRQNQGYVDHLSVDATSGIEFFQRAEGTTSWIKLSSLNMTTALSKKYVDIRIVFRRNDLRSEAPVFRKLFLRYGVLPKTEIQLPGDVPPNTEAVSLEEYGFNEQFGTVSVVLGSAGHGRSSKITTFSHDDFLYNIERGRHWKITEVKPNYALGIFTSFDVTARWVQDFEIYKRFPT